MKRRNPSPLRVMTATAWDDPGQLLGIVRYARDAGWTFCRADGYRPSAIAAWKPDGLICQLHPNSEALVRAVRRAAVPVVELHAYLPAMRVPRVLLDEEAAGRLGAAHFLERNFRRLVHLARRGMRRGVPRASVRGFQACAARAGAAVEAVNLDSPAFWRARDLAPPDRAHGMSDARFAEAMIRWLTRGPEPVAVFSESPQFALDLVDAGVRLGVNIPDQLAVLMLSWEPHQHEMAAVPVSCIRWNLFDQGYRAAETLDRLMRGGKVPETQWIPPLPVDVRESTDTVATRARPVAEALRYFRLHAMDPGFSLDGAASALGVSVSTLHRWFKTHARCTPAEMIERRRVDHAIDLLRHRGASVEEATRQCGFSEPRQLRRALKRRLGTAPRTLQSLVFDAAPERAAQRR